MRLLVIKHSFGVVLAALIAATTGLSPLHAAPARLTQQEALEQLARREKVTIVAEIAAPSLRLESTGAEQLDWNNISQAFDLHSMRRPSAAALLRRNIDLEQPLDIELEEWKLILSDLDRLLRPFVPYPVDIDSIRRENQFANSFSTAQIERMRSGGLPFKALTPAQQALWLQINAASVFSSQNLVIERTARAFDKWSSQHLIWHPRPDGLTSLVMQTLERKGGFSLTDNSRSSSPQSQFPPSMDLLKEREALPSAWKRTVELEAGEQTLQELLRSIERATGATLQSPDYAKNRRLLVFPQGARAIDLAAALEDIYGWELRHLRGKSWVLDRPRFAPARDVMDLHARMTRAMPPGLRLMMRATWFRGPGPDSPDFFMLGSNHRGRIYAAMMKEVNALHGTDWKQLRVADLPKPVQRKIANLLPLVDCLSMLKAFFATPLPRARVISPTEGVFTAGGEPGSPLKGSSFLFSVQGPDGRIDSWGWGVGTSSLEN